MTANGYTCAGYQLSGWTTNVDGTGTGYADKELVLNLTAVNNAIITLYAQWMINPTDRVTVTFVSGDPSKGTLGGTLVFTGIK